MYNIVEFPIMHTNKWKVLLMKYVGNGENSRAVVIEQKTIEREQINEADIQWGQSDTIKND